MNVKLNLFLSNLIDRYNHFMEGDIKLSHYQSFLESVEPYKKLNEIYLHVARLKKPSFFILHHDIYTNYTRMMELAQLEHSLGWSSTYFVPQDTTPLNKESARVLWNMKHDLGLLYNSLDIIYQENPKISEQDKINKAWMHYRNTLTKNLELNFTVAASYRRALGIDNARLWRDFNYRQMHIRCDAEMDLCEKETVYFIISGYKVRYLLRRCDGSFFDVRPGLRIDGVRDLGKRLKQGNMVDRVIVRFIWR